MKFVAAKPETSSITDKIPASFSSFRASPSEISGKRSKKVTPKTSGCIQKSSQERKEKRQRQETMEVLKDLLPSVPHGENVGKLELLQGVIDYIYELQQQLLEPADAYDSEIFESEPPTSFAAGTQTCRSETEGQLRKQPDLESLSLLLKQIGSC